MCVSVNVFDFRWSLMARNITETTGREKERERATRRKLEETAWKTTSERQDRPPPHRWKGEG